MLDNELLKLWNKFETTGNVNDYLEFARVSRGEAPENAEVFVENAALPKVGENFDDN